jgi:hypothetical protein
MKTEDLITFVLVTLLVSAWLWRVYLYRASERTRVARKEGLKALLKSLLNRP